MREKTINTAVIIMFYSTEYRIAASACVEKTLNNNVSEDSNINRNNSNTET